ncbi:hypothetical protein [Streptomyces desertarenae]|uniref:hypothetical protein n=1 Tax=Streptomyces desertarenae TaxID=2666184 RepID=UPI003AA9BF61
MRYADGGGLTAVGRRRRESVRMQAAELFEQEIEPSEVARRLRVSMKPAYRRHRLWRGGGREAPASRGPSGPRCRLSPRCPEKLAAYLDQGPAAHGWVGDQVRAAARMATLIDGVHRLVEAPVVLVRDRLNTHVPHAIDGFIAGTGLTLDEPATP